MENVGENVRTETKSIFSIIVILFLPFLSVRIDETRVIRIHSFVRRHFVFCKDFVLGDFLVSCAWRMRSSDQCWLAMLYRDCWEKHGLVISNVTGVHDGYETRLKYFQSWGNTCTCSLGGVRDDVQRTSLKSVYFLPPIIFSPNYFSLRAFWHFQWP